MRGGERVQMTMIRTLQGKQSAMEGGGRSLPPHLPQLVLGYVVETSTSLHLDEYLRS